jgi:hypothetical protein
MVVHNASRQGINAQTCFTTPSVSQTATQRVESYANESSTPLGGKSTAGSTATGEDADSAVMDSPAKRAKTLKGNKYRYTYKKDHAGTYGVRI